MFGLGCAARLRPADACLAYAAAIGIALLLACAGAFLPSSTRPFVMPLLALGSWLAAAPPTLPYVPQDPQITEKEAEHHPASLAGLAAFLWFMFPTYLAQGLLEGLVPDWSLSFVPWQAGLVSALGALACWSIVRHGPLISARKAAGAVFVFHALAALFGLSALGMMVNEGVISALTGFMVPLMAGAVAGNAPGKPVRPAFWAVLGVILGIFILMVNSGYALGEDIAGSKAASFWIAFLAATAAALMLAPFGGNASPDKAKADEGGPDDAPLPSESGQLQPRRTGGKTARSRPLSVTPERPRGQRRSRTAFAFHKRCRRRRAIAARFQISPFP